MIRHAINNEYIRRVKKGIFFCNLGTYITAISAKDVASVTLLAIPVDSINRAKGGRPFGTYNKQKYNKSKAEILSKDEITQMYIIEFEQNWE